MTEENRILFHRMLNSRKNPRRAYRILALLAREPILNDVADMPKELDILRRMDIITDDPGSNKRIENIH